MNAKPGKFLALLYYSFIISSIILKTESSFKKDSVLSYIFYSTVTLFARFLGLSTSSPLATLT